MTEIKTQKNDGNILQFLNLVEHKTRKRDGLVLYDLFCDICKEPGDMWGQSIIGFGNTKIQYANGSVTDFLKIGFSPRKQYIALYLISGFAQYDQLLSKLGKHKTSKACLYINKLADIDLQVLQELITLSFHYEP
ncbi:DUF1801 domain-containing protein [Marinicellulosiphila megalodicopiae]|uniref:DUF1801 domain-containing protein n=1 Tax=Marinicellulosiphila megalodicopiae TaxID=2724896 RepID=UPI003BB09278